MNDGVTAAVAVIAVLLWHSPQLYVLASCQGLGQGLSIKVYWMWNMHIEGQ